MPITRRRDITAQFHWNARMAQLIVRNLEDAVKRRLRKRAKSHGRSMEEEVRVILREAVNAKPSGRKGLGTQLAELFADVPPEFKIV